jgi:hypothetical protein
VLITQILLLYVNLSQLKNQNPSSNYLYKRDAQMGIPNTNQTAPKEPLKCNGDPDLCDLNYDQVVKKNISLLFYFFKKLSKSSLSPLPPFHYFRLTLERIIVHHII